MSKTPTVLSFTRSLNPGHFLLYSAPAVDATDLQLTPVTVREEPLRGLNASTKTTEDEKTKAVLQVVESANLAAGDSVLVIKGKLLVNSQYATPQSCNEFDFYAAHAATIAQAQAAGDIKELSKRFALTIAMGAWGWRNALEADSVKVTVTHDNECFVFEDVLPDADDIFNLDTPAYAPHREALLGLALLIENALTKVGGRGTNLSIRADLTMGIGARVYPSQEWASSQMKKASIENWPGGKGVTRVLAKIRTREGALHAIINDRKIGNALRNIDTWYPSATPNTPIAIEPFGANAHMNKAYRTASADSVFGIVNSIVEKRALTPEQRKFYTAVCIRGGVFSGGE